VAVFSRNTTTGALTFVEFQRDEDGSVDGLDAARSVAVSPDGKHLYVAGQTDDAVAVFSIAVTPATPVPSVSQWGLFAMAGTLAALLLWRRRRVVDRAQWGRG
jgi:DNA-binding beta-propeller fold protein YncE